MSNDKREILRDILNGKLSEKQALTKLKTRFRDNEIVMVIKTSNGLYTLKEESGLTESEMHEATKGEFVLLVGEHQTSLIERVNQLNSER